jgi:hypothetical protein
MKSNEASDICRDQRNLVRAVRRIWFVARTFRDPCDWLGRVFGGSRSAGAYEAALRAEPLPYTPANSGDASGLTLIQVNLAEAEYNLGRWHAAEERLRPLDLARGAFDIARAGLFQQRAWILAQRGRGDEALDLCARVKPKWLPRTYRAEYHFTRAAALLACRRLDEAD